MMMRRMRKRMIMIEMMIIIRIKLMMMMRIKIMMIIRMRLRMIPDQLQRGSL